MKRRNKRIRYDRIIICAIVLVLIIGGIIFFITRNDNPINNSSGSDKMVALKDLSEANFIANQYNLEINITYEYNDEIEKDGIISQSIKEGEEIVSGSVLNVVVSLGKLDKEQLASDEINELGTVPIMMYHAIRERTSTDTGTIGGNVDKDGYNRTPEAFREDLEFYYENGYRMIRLADYIEGKIDVEYGKSPIILTFDDGNDNNIKVTGLDENGDIIIDENSAVGIMEAFKKEHPDMNITATFFVNGELFNQPEYNEKIIKWLVEHGYDVGNHTETHLDIKESSADRVQKEIVSVYNQLESIIPGQYVNIVALPFGSPYNKTHSNYQYVLNSTYDGKTYETVGALRVGWEPEVSPFNKDFDPTFLKRCRAYDNNGEEFDIEMVFDMLETRRYISDGNINTVVTSSDNESIVGNTDLEVIYY